MQRGVSMPLIRVPAPGIPTSALIPNLGGRMKRRLARIGILTAGLAALSAPLALSGIVSATPEPVGGAAAAEVLECPPDDLILQATYEGFDPSDPSLNGVPGESSSEATADEAPKDTDDEALQEFVADEQPELPTGFEQVAADGDATQFVQSEDGDVKASVLAERVGDGWYVPEFTACDSYLDELNEGSGQ